MHCYLFVAPWLRTVLRSLEAWRKLDLETKLKLRAVKRALPMLELEAWPKLDIRTLHIFNRALPMLELEALPKLKLRTLPLLMLIRPVPILEVELEVFLVLEIRAMPLLEIWTVVMLGPNAA